MKAAIVLVCVLAQVLAQTNFPTTHHHVTHDSNENERYSFSYDRVEHNMIIKVFYPMKRMTECYVAAMSPQEQKAVHTDHGIRNLELKLLGQVDSATKVTADQLTNHTSHMCGHAATLYTIP